MGGSILGVKVIGQNGLTVIDSNSQIGGSQFGTRDLNQSLKIKSVGKSSRTGKKVGSRPIHVVDDFSSFDAQM